MKTNRYNLTVLSGGLHHVEVLADHYYIEYDCYRFYDENDSLVSVYPIQRTIIYSIDHDIDNDSADKNASADSIVNGNEYNTLVKD
jgi:hypothetical protein